MNMTKDELQSCISNDEINRLTVVKAIVAARVAGLLYLIPRVVPFILLLTLSIRQFGWVIGNLIGCFVAYVIATLVYGYYAKIKTPVSGQAEKEVKTNKVDDAPAEAGILYLITWVFLFLLITTIVIKSTVSVTPLIVGLIVASVIATLISWYHITVWSIAATIIMLYFII
jgi:hypothetical protein